MENPKKKNTLRPLEKNVQIQIFWLNFTTETNITKLKTIIIELNYEMTQPCNIAFGFLNRTKKSDRPNLGVT